MHVRDLVREDYLPYQRLCAMAFGGSVPADGADFPPGSVQIGIEAPDGSGQIAAGLRVMDEKMAVGGALATCGAVGGVAVHPAYRGHGLFRALMTEAVSRSTRHGHAFSMLYPSHSGIYHRLGYQSIARIQRLVVPVASLAQIPAVPDRRLIPVTQETFAEVRSLYRELVLRENGLLSRENPAFGGGTLPAQPWNAMLVLDEEGTAQGYLSYARTPDGPGGTEIELFDVVGRARKDVAALLGSLASWSTVADAVLLRPRTDDPALDVIPGGRLRPDPRILPDIMLRVLDTSAALSCRPAPESLRGELRLEVADATLPEGSSRAAADLRVSIADGVVACRPAHSADPALPGVRLDVHSASLVLAGGRSLDDARRMGLFVEADPDAELLLDHLLAGPRPSVLDFF